MSRYRLRSTQPSRGGSSAQKRSFFFRLAAHRRDWHVKRAAIKCHPILAEWCGREQRNAAQSNGTARPEPVPKNQTPFEGNGATTNLAPDRLRPKNKAHRAGAGWRATAYTHTHKLNFFLFFFSRCWERAVQERRLGGKGKKEPARCPTRQQMQSSASFSGARCSSTQSHCPFRSFLDARPRAGTRPH